MSSARNKFISNEQAVPIIEADVFETSSSSRFAIGAFSAADLMNYQQGSLLQSYLRLRGNVYIDQTRMLQPEAWRSDKTEMDDDDERSVHYVVLENMLGRCAVFACMRLIEKLDDRKLPIEEFYPESFSESLPLGSYEASRFTSRHNNHAVNSEAKRTMVTAGFAHTLKNDGRIFGVVEPDFQKDLNLMGVTNYPITDTHFVEEYNDENLGIEIDRAALQRRLGRLSIKRLDLSSNQFIYWGDIAESQLVEARKAI